MKKKILFAAFVLVTLLLITEPNFSWLNGGIFFDWEENLLEPLFVTVLFLLVNFILLAVFNPTIQQKWWRWARWVIVVPVGFILVGLTQPQGSGFISFGGMTELVILWGILFAAATCVYVLLQRFWFKVGINLNT